MKSPTIKQLESWFRRKGEQMPTKPTYLARFVGGPLDSRQQSMYGKIPWDFFDKSEHFSNADGTFVRRSNYYKLVEPLKKVPPGCPTLVYQYSPNFVPSSKRPEKQVA